MRPPSLQIILSFDPDLTNPESKSREIVQILLWEGLHSPECKIDLINLPEFMVFSDRARYLDQFLATVPTVALQKIKESATCTEALHKINKAFPYGCSFFVSEVKNFSPDLLNTAP